MKVLQLIDSLEAGGAERMAVSYANMLATEITSYLCTTRAEGALKNTIAPQVGYLFLNKKSALDVKAMLTLRKFVKFNGIDVIHAHSSSYFLAVLVKLSYPKLKIVWHCHLGASNKMPKKSFLALKYFSIFFNTIFCVNHALIKWASQNLWCRKVYYIPNFVTKNKERIQYTVLQGKDNKRIVCVANLRPDKDHLNLVQAFQQVQQKHPEWSLHLVGKDFKDDYAASIRSFIVEHHLEKKVFIYGSCPDVDAILQQCQIGVLSSKSEGLPVSLLEYGKNNLPIVVTNVGECAKVITHQKSGLVVEKQNDLVLANAIIDLIENQKLASIFANSLNEHIAKNYSESSVKSEIIELYKKVLKN